MFEKELLFPSSGFGLQIVDVEKLQPGFPKLEFLNDRWPQITYSVKGYNVTVRLFCQKGTVIQQFTVTKTLASTADLHLTLDVGFLMHDLDYMNEVNYELTYEHGPHDYGVIVFGRKNEEKTEAGTSEQVGVLVGLFRNGESEKLSLSDNRHRSERIAVERNYSLQEIRDIGAYSSIQTSVPETQFGLV